MRKKEGDTLVEVSIAIGIFSMVAIAAVAVMSGSASSAQTALETTLAREEIDVQAEALRFIHSAYLSETGSNSNQKTYSDLWDEITKNAIKVEDSSEGAVRRDKRRRLREARGLLLHRHERPRAVRDGGRPRQRRRVAPLPADEPSRAEAHQDDRRRGEGARHTRLRMRRVGGRPDSRNPLGGHGGRRAFRLGHVHTGPLQASSQALPRRPRRVRKGSRIAWRRRHGRGGLRRLPRLDVRQVPRSRQHSPIGVANEKQCKSHSSLPDADPAGRMSRHVSDGKLRLERRVHRRGNASRHEAEVRRGAPCARRDARTVLRPRDRRSPCGRVDSLRPLQRLRSRPRPADEGRRHGVA